MNDSIYNYIFESLGLIVGIAAVFFHTVSIRKQAETSRLNLFQELQSDFFSDELTINAYYLIEHHEFEFGSYGKTRTQEKGIDRLMFKLNNICKLFESNELKDREFRFFEYYFVMTISNPQAIEYLEYISKVTKLMNIRDPYYYLNKTRKNYKTVDIGKYIGSHLKAA